MGLGLLLLAVGAFLRFVLGRYAVMQAAFDFPGTILMIIGAALMIVTVLRCLWGTPVVVLHEVDPAPDVPNEALPAPNRRP